LQPDEEECMRRVFYRGVVVSVVSLVLAAGAFGIPREGREAKSRDRDNAVVKFVKRVVRSLGDGLIIPTPKKP
jgi:hypothetical protein